MAKKIYLSPSNQNANVYAYGNTNEMVQCNRIAECAEKALKRCGFSVKKAKQGQEMAKSISESNNWNADLHIPIHTNAYNGKVTGGTLVMLYGDSAENVKAGKAILNAVAPVSPGSDYTLRYRPELAELNSTRCIAVYLEVEFHDTKEGAKWIIENVEAIGEALAKGICKYYGVKYVAPASTETTVEKVSYETAAVQVLLRQAHKLGIVTTYVTPVDNKKGKLTNSAIIEAREYMGYKNPTNSIDLKFITDLEETIVKTRKAKINELEKMASGDYNKDGKVDIKDATLLQKKIAGIEG